MHDDRTLSLSEIRSFAAEQLDLAPESIRDDDNLVELGLHSMRMIKLASAWRRTGLEVNFGELASAPSVRAWHELLNARSAEPEAEPPRLPTPRTETDETFGLATMQHAYWVGRSDEQALGGVAAHLYAEFDGHGLDRQRLERAVAALVQRHPMLRCQFLDNGRQRVLAQPQVPVWSCIDLRERGDEVDDELARVREEKTHQRMRADLGQVFDVTLTLLPGGRNRLHVDVDMLAADALSYRTLMADLTRLYREGEHALPAIDYSYRRYLADHAEANAAEREREREWWLQRLPDLPQPPILPLVPEADRADRHRTVRHEHWIDAADKHRLLERARRHGVTPAATLAAIFAEVLGRWSRSQRFLLNVPLFNREPTHPDVDLLAGDFSSSIMLDMDCSEPGSVLDRARDVQRGLHTSAAHAAYPGLDVLRDLGRYQGESLLAPVVYTSGLDLGELFEQQVVETLGEPVWIVSQGPQVVLDAQVVELRGGLLLNWDVREQAFPPGVAQAMFDRQRQLIQALIEADSYWELPLSEGLPPQQAEVRRQVDGVSAPRSGRSLHDGFFAAARETPDATALIGPCSQRLSYATLRDKALRVAAALRHRGVLPGQAVSIQLPKGPDQVVAVLGVLAAGATYVPVGADQPPARRDRIQQIGAVQLGLVDADAADDQTVPALPLDLAARFADPLPDPEPVDPGSIAYVLFTSGSTGEPKGVEVPHSAAMNTLERCAERFAVTSRDRSLALSPLEFDLSVQDVFGLLGAGGSVVVADEQTRRDGQRIAELLRDHEVTQLYCVPGLLEMILTAGRTSGLGESLRTVLVGGDRVDVELPKRLRELVPDCRFAGLGGATETAIHHTVCEVGAEVPADWKSVPFGVPLGNVHCRVVNESGADCPDYVPGELWVGGDGLALGYRGDPERTADRFVEHAGQRWYRTGDLARYLPDGVIDFLGRRDQQVKVRGYRIELGEVEAALRAVAGVRSAVAEVIGDQALKLVAAVVADDATGPEALRDAVAEVLPPYMVPERIELLAAIPLTGSGKVDRHAVRAGLSADQAEQEFVPPASDLESALARIVGEVLSVRRVGVATDFFALGGDSVLGTTAVAQIREWLDTSEVSVADLYTGRHVRGLAERLAQRQRTPGRLEQVAALYLEVADMSEDEVDAESAAG